MGLDRMLLGVLQDGSPDHYLTIQYVANFPTKCFDKHLFRVRAEIIQKITFSSPDWLVKLMMILSPGVRLRRLCLKYIQIRFCKPMNNGKSIKNRFVKSFPSGFEIGLCDVSEYCLNLFQPVVNQNGETGFTLYLHVQMLGIEHRPREQITS